MKVSRKQLRRMISTVLLKEGWFKDAVDSVTDASSVLTTGTFSDNLKKESSEDAFDLFISMQGLGTDESKIEMIIQKRSASRSLVDLYNEYDKMLNYLNDDMAAKYLAPAMGAYKAGNWDGDLIDWLDGDGMDDAADLIEAALTEAGMQRKDFEFTFLGI